jgi:UDP-N-acetylglucosamine 2-epimerase
MGKKPRVDRPNYLRRYELDSARLAAGLQAIHSDCSCGRWLAKFRRMPEKINRVAADHLLSDLLLRPSDRAVRNIAAEGIAQNVHLVGDVRLGVLNWAKQKCDGTQCTTLDPFGLSKQSYLLATAHGSQNTDNIARVSSHSWRVESKSNRDR